jgi:hypothetical protein
MSAERATLTDVDRAQAAEVLRVASWARRRKWSKTDTQRWLSDRSARVLAWVRRRRPMAPSHSHKMGYWLNEYDRVVFDRAHAALLRAANDEAREALLVEEVLR